ncbi:MAG: phenylalanine--tRNA ligase subunit alpha [Nanoarchaeota archaeon]
MTDIIAGLHPLERRAIPHLAASNTLSDLCERSGMAEVEATRAIQWLSNKDVLSIENSTREEIFIDTNGQRYQTIGLPERRLINFLHRNKTFAFTDAKKADLEAEEVGPALGFLKKKALVEMNDNVVTLSATGLAFCATKKKWLEEDFLTDTFPKDKKTLSDEAKYSFASLAGRKKIVAIRQIKEKHIALTDDGKALVARFKDTAAYEDRLTAEMLKSASWKGKKFRAYDVTINVPAIHGGKRHFVNQAKEYARRIWLDMGFQEMHGQIINTSFWNFDALYTAQDHPVREMQDTFYIRNPAKGALPKGALKTAIQATHQDGGKTSSTGWSYNWDEEEARKNVLRTHTTVLSALTLSKLRKTDYPAKFFSFGRCYRNEAVDWSHLFEFNQTEGIVIDPNANFRHLLGYLRAFFSKMGFEKARFRPAHFPYTEPSVEIDVFHPARKTWIELGGAGMFRPEVVVPLLGHDVPVLAWGPGFDRIIMDHFAINDMRDLYRNDLRQLREMKYWTR